MSNLVGRVLGEQWKSSFRFEMRNSLEEGKDIFEIKDGADSTIVIRGNSGLAMACGFNYYLKNYVNVDYNPLYGSNVNLDELKPVGEKVVREAQLRGISGLVRNERNQSGTGYCGTGRSSSADAFGISLYGRRNQRLYLRSGIFCMVLYAESL